jgi:hypothetical protein
MEIQISVFWVVLLLVILLVITEHLHNWWARYESDTHFETIGIFLFTYIIKWAFFILILKTLFE